MKKIKAFNVEEDTYNKLLSIFKKYKVNASLSSFVNNCLEDLLKHIQEVEEIKRLFPKSKLPIQFVIAEMTKSLENKKTVDTMLFMGGTERDHQMELASGILEKWEDEYEARNLGISDAMYSHFKEGGYMLSPNKEYLINEKTGKKYIAIKTERLESGTLLEIREE